MSLIICVLLTGAFAIAGTVLCPPPSGSPSNRPSGGDRLPSLALAAILAACTFAAGRPAVAGGAITGQATVRDGSTIEVGGVPLTLFGVAAPKAGETCWDSHEESYACGHRSRSALAARIGGNPLTCDRRGDPATQPAKAVCRIGDEDLGAWMLGEGYAVPDGDAPVTYRKASDTAWGRRVGLWSGVFSTIGKAGVQPRLSD